MKKSFFGYYPPSTQEYEQLWNEGLVVLDTNVLLNLYRLPVVARDELLSVLDSLKERLWIPHQVALEFHRKRLSVIASERKAIEDALASASELMATVGAKVSSLQLEKRGLELTPDALISELDQANTKLVEAIKKAHSSQLDISALDPVRDRLDELLADRVGAGPANQAELDALCIDGENRYRDNIPPGYKDADKDKNPNESSFMFDHIKYQRKYGDLILWRQLIRHVKDVGIKKILLITADRKEDWWWREQGKTIGPHPELVREIQREAGAELFWMYSSVQFVEHANMYSSTKVSTQSVAEIQNVMSSRATDALIPRREVPTDNSPYSPYEARFAIPNPGVYYENRPETPLHSDMQYRLFAVGKWLTSFGYDVAYNERSFPDIVAKKDGRIHGYELAFSRNWRKSIFSPKVAKSSTAGHIEKIKGDLDTFSLLFLISEEEYFKDIDESEDDQVGAQCANLLSKYSVNEIVIGSVIQGNFEVLFKMINPAL